MRKLKLLALALLIGGVSAFAYNVEDPEVPTKKIRSQIIELLQEPGFVVAKDIEVVIKFTFSSEGEIVVLCPGCDSKQVKNYIRENLNYKKFEYPGVQDKLYTMPLKIQAI